MKGQGNEKALNLSHRKLYNVKPLKKYSPVFSMCKLKMIYLFLSKKCGPLNCSTNVYVECYKWRTI